MLSLLNFAVFSKLTSQVSLRSQWWCGDFRGAVVEVVERFSRHSVQFKQRQKVGVVACAIFYFCIAVRISVTCVYN